MDAQHEETKGGRECLVRMLNVFEFELTHRGVHGGLLVTVVSVIELSLTGLTQGLAADGALYVIAFKLGGDSHSPHTRKRTLRGSYEGVYQSSTLESIGRPSLLIESCTRSTVWSPRSHVLRVLPWTRTEGVVLQMSAARGEAASLGTEARATAAGELPTPEARL